MTVLNQWCSEKVICLQVNILTPLLLNNSCMSKISLYGTLYNNVRTVENVLDLFGKIIMKLLL